MDYQNNDGSTHESNVAKKRHSPAELKASKHDLVDQSRSEENDTALPEPTFRQVPVNVTRRTDSPVVPMPPPRNTKASDTKPQRRNSNKKSKRRIDGDNGSDSDSDRDELNRKSDQDGVIALPKKVSNENEGDENERLRQYRMLKKKRNKAFVKISQNRQVIIQNATVIIESLVSIRKEEFDRPPLNEKIIYQQENLQDYLEENSTGDNNGGPSTMLEDGAKISMDKIIDDVEAGVVRIYSHHFGKPGSSDGDRFAQILEVISGLEQYLGLKRCASDSDPMPCFDVWSGFGVDYKVERILDVLTENHLRDVPKYSYTGTLINWMVEQYWYNIVTAMRDDVASAQTQITQQTCDIGSGTRNWKEVIEQSRQEGQLNLSYIRWVTTGIDTSMLRDVQDKFLRQRGMPDQFCDTTDSQEFCPNLMAPRTVSLALAKGHIVTRTKEVSEDDLAGFGWYRESLSQPLWRCQPVGVGRDIVKVDVDGNVLGLFALKRGGSDWIDWVLLEPSTYLDQPRARPISEREADVLGLRGYEPPKLPEGWLSAWP